MCLYLLAWSLTFPCMLLFYCRPLPVHSVTFGLLNKDDLARAIKENPQMPATRAKLAVPFIGTRTCCS